MEPGRQPTGGANAGSVALSHGRPAAGLPVGASQSSNRPMAIQSLLSAPLSASAPSPQPVPGHPSLPFGTTATLPPPPFPFPSQYHRTPNVSASGPSKLQTGTTLLPNIPPSTIAPLPRPIPNPDHPVISAPAMTTQKVEPYTRNYVVLHQIEGGQKGELHAVLGDHADWTRIPFISLRNRPICKPGQHFDSHTTSLI